MQSFIFFGITLLVLGLGSEVGGKTLLCNVCKSMAEDQVTTCVEPSSYMSVNCTSKLPLSNYCVIINGNYTTVDGRNRVQQAIGPRRTCQFDLDRYGLDEKNLRQGCHDVSIDKIGYLTYKHFHFDGKICLCNDEDNCNVGDYWVPKIRPPNSASSLVSETVILFFFAVLLI